MPDMSKIPPYQKIGAWQSAYKLIIEIYITTAKFPPEERYGLTSQMRRAAVSVAANIVEGRAKPTEKDFLRYLFIAKGSLEECGFFIKLSKDLNYITQDQYLILDSMRSQTGYMLHRFIDSIRN